MKWYWRKNIKLILPVRAGRVQPATLAERGQALVVIAMAMVGLLAFIGLTVDAGILFIGEGHLRRAVDAAALAAAAQFRSGQIEDKLYTAAGEVLRLNGVHDATYQMTMCNAGDPNYNAAYDETLVHPGSTLCNGVIRRKLVKIVAQVPVRFAFLGIIGIPSTTVVADSVSETASVDVVLVIDTSNSMTFDVARNGTTYTNTTNMWWPNNCNAATPADPADAAAGYTGNCLPFLDVKKAAVGFINHLYYPYDRLSIVTFDYVPTVVEPITNTDTPDVWETKVKQLNVSEPRDPNNGPLTPAACTWSTWGTDPSGCTNTSTGGALLQAGNQFGLPPVRQESVWVVILLTDGAANASYPDPNNASIVNIFCPGSTWSTDTNHYNPFCRAADKTTRHTQLNPAVYNSPQYDPGHVTPYEPTSGSYTPQNQQYAYNSSSPGQDYDADDYARDEADFVACASKYSQAAKLCRNSLDYTTNHGGQGALIYAIGLGQLVIDNSQGGGVSDGNAYNGEARIDPSDSHAGYAAGDTLLRYVAHVGSGGDPDQNSATSPDPCLNTPPPALVAQPILSTTVQVAPKLASAGNVSYNCGNYYFSQFGTGLTSVFQSIASRIFTRITQ